MSNASSWSRRWSRLWSHGAGELTLAAVVLAVVAMMIVPLPTPLIDLLVSLNLASGVLLLSAVLFTRNVLTFSSFPTLLLLSTLLRLALNVASARLILLDADAGRVIAAFGQVVVRGDFAVGALLFVVITVVQLIVVIKGAERVAEVSARFNLDALPGRQLAIDAALRAGTLSQGEARRERHALTEESQLFGALDGAMKLVRGDALAGLIIASVNLLGGIGIGVLERGLSLSQCVSTYGVLAIGDGLVSQIPSLLSATAAGLIVTRARADKPLFEQLSTQLFGDARAVSSAAVVLLALALVPGLPAWPLLAVAGLCTLFALRLTRARRAPLDDARAATARVALALSDELATALDEARRSALRESLAQQQEQTLRALGFAMSPPELCRDPSLTARTAAFWVDGSEVLRVELGATASFEAQVGAELEQLLRHHAPELLSLEELSRLVRELEQRAPVLSGLAFPKHVPLPRLLLVARRLLAEGLPLRPLEEIVESLLESDANAAIDDLVESLRTSLRRRVSAQVAPGGRLHVLRLSAEIVEALEDALFEDHGRRTLALEPGLEADIRSAIAQAAGRAPSPRALLVDSRLRRHVAELVADRRTSLRVLKPSELSPELQISETTLVSP